MVAGIFAPAGKTLLRLVSSGFFRLGIHIVQVDTLTAKLLAPGGQSALGAYVNRTGDLGSYDTRGMKYWTVSTRGVPGSTFRVAVCISYLGRTSVLFVFNSSQ